MIISSAFPEPNPNRRRRLTGDPLAAARRLLDLHDRLMTVAHAIIVRIQQRVDQAVTSADLDLCERLLAQTDRLFVAGNAILAACDDLIESAKNPLHGSPLSSSFRTAPPAGRPRKQTNNPLAKANPRLFRVDDREAGLN